MKRVVYIGVALIIGFLFGLLYKNTISGKPVLSEDYSETEEVSQQSKSYKTTFARLNKSLESQEPS